MSTSTYLQLGTKSDPCREHAPLPTEQSGEGEYGVITLQVQDWVPKNARSVPPSITDGMGTAISRILAVTFNASENASERRRWALLTNSGTVLLLTGVEQRPSTPTDFPPNVRRVLTKAEAEKRAEIENQDRFRLARIPREWSVAVCPLTEGTGA